MGYVGPDGEVHISENDSWLACAGQDNTSTDCSTGDVPNIFEGNMMDHIMVLLWAVKLYTLPLTPIFLYTVQGV